MLATSSAPVDSRKMKHSQLRVLRFIAMETIAVHEYLRAPGTIGLEFAGAARPSWSDPEDMKRVFLGLASYQTAVQDVHSAYRQRVAEFELAHGRKLKRFEAPQLAPSEAQPLRHGLTTLHWSPKAILGRAPTRNESAELSRALTKLEHRGFVERVDSQRGKKVRRHRVRMTREGARVAAALLLSGCLGRVEN